MSKNEKGRVSAYKIRFTHSSNNNKYTDVWLYYDKEMNNWFIRFIRTNKHSVLNKIKPDTYQFYFDKSYEIVQTMK